MKKGIIRRVVPAALSGVMLFSASFSGWSTDVNVFSSPSVVYAASEKISDFSISDVKMTDQYVTNAFSLELKYLLSFDSNRLLAGFRENAGMNTFGAKRYGGWENTLIGGHSVGHYLTALSQAYQNPNISAEERDALMNKMKVLVDGMKECQKNSKGQPGFVWAAPKGNQQSVEFQFDNIENRKTNIIQEAWVPWYTMHKLIAGLVDVYKNTGYEPAKEVASGLGDWTYNRCSKWSSQTHATVLSVEYGGMNDCLYDLYSVTQNQKYADAAHFFDETALFDRVLSGGTDVLNGKHANTTIPKFMGALKRYMVLGGKDEKYLEYAKSFWDMVTTHHTYITGGNSEWEHFGKDDILDAERTNCNCETCNSYNMLKLSRELFKITGDKKYMDFYERTYYNSILSSQNPETGMTTYFQPMATGYFKVYSSEYDHFWCCTGSGMESFSKLGDTMYMHSGNTLYVNFYQSSVLTWKEQNVKITQESTIPDGETVTFTVEGSGDLDLRFRIPDWKAGNITVKVNGQKTAYTDINGYAQISRSFSNGDKIELTIPEEVQAHTLQDAKGKAYAFTYGPVVLSAELGTENMKKGSTGMWVSIPEEKIAGSENITVNKENGSVPLFMSDIGKYLTKDPSSMKFTLNGTNRKLVFTPHYRQYQQRYGIYWYFNNADSVTDTELPRAKYTVTDTVQPGYGQYENDDLHNMQEYLSKSVTSDSTYRYTSGNGYFGYQMAVDEAAQYSVLTVKFRKEDNGKTIKVRVGDKVLYNEKLSYEGNSDVYDVKLIVPPEVISSCVKSVEANGTTYSAVDVFFSSADGRECAKVCDFIYMTAVKPLYESDSSIAYFVDCGDHDTSTLTGTDKLGYYNSRTEQVYGEDEVTGAVWGIIDDTNDQYNGSSKSKGIYTANTWANEHNTADNQSKENSNRYTKNQYENNIARHLDYGFTLPDGSYNVEIGFCDPWKCSNNPSVYANFGTDNQSTVAENVPINGNTSVKGKVNVTDGRLTLNFRSEDKAINVSYIIIRFDEKVPLPSGGIKGDLNSDGKVNSADAVIMQKYMLSDEGVFDGYSADMDNSCSLGITDMILVKNKIIG